MIIPSVIFVRSRVKKKLNQLVLNDEMIHEVFFAFGRGSKENQVFT